MATPSASTRAEYQHFVPQFLLRNFSKPDAPPRNSSKRQQKVGKGNEKIHHVDLTADELAVEVVPVRRVMGMNNMYEDLGQATPKQRRHVEDMFGRLEGESSRIFRSIIKGVEDGNKGIWLPREDRNVLRRFLFLLMYRGSQSHRRFYHATPDEYKSEDEIELHQYMLDRGFDRPVDVWFGNIKAIAECKMDAAGQWMEEIQQRMYPPDARWFCHHTQQSYMAVCCPEDEEAEFLLAENSYSVYEGIDSFLVSPMTGEQTSGPWVGFHYFAPVSPRIVIVLRSNILPLPEEDINDDIRGERDQWRAAAVDQWFGADRQSELADLPITKARNNYTEMANGQLRELKPHETRSSGDRFFFKFFRTNNNHVSKINSFILDGARASVVFASRTAFTRTLEWYMTDTSKTWKNVVGTAQERNSKATLLRKLSALVKSQGSNAEPVWQEGPTARSLRDCLAGERRINDVRSLYRMVMDDIIKDIDREAAKTEPPPTPFLELYTKLGGTLDSRFYNVQQSGRMLNLRIKLNVWTQGAPESVREKCRQMLQDMYLCLPPVRLWLYAKQVRNMLLRGPGKPRTNLDMQSEVFDKPEDVVAAAISPIAQCEVLNRHIYNTAMNSIEKDKRPGLEIWDPTSASDLRHGVWMNKFVSRSGPIFQCGLPGIKELAARELASVFQHGVCPEAEAHRHIFDHPRLVELSVRIKLRAKFEKGAVQGLEALSGSVLQIWFSITYPTPPVLETR